jgi:hypothetical protein
VLLYRDTLFAAGQVRLCLHHFPKQETRGTAVKVLNHPGDEYKGVLCSSFVIISPSANQVAQANHIHGTRIYPIYG